MSQSPYTFSECKQCGSYHIGAPSFAFDSPHYYSALNESDKKQSFLNSDFCIVRAQNEENYFIRAVLEIPIIGSEEPFLWGVWISQSKENFKFYRENFEKDLEDRQSFGWFSNILPYYENTLGMKTHVVFGSEDSRPKVHIEHSDHAISKDFHHGISQEKAIEIAEKLTH